MHNYNLIIIGFIGALFVLALWWSFNTVRQIEVQKNFCAQPLSSIAKLWRRAKFVPEDAKDRESLYLYRDFLRKFDESECKYPIMVKNGGVRCMTRKEYDDLCGQKNKRPFSVLIGIVSLIIACASIWVNLTVTKDIWMGIGLAAIMPLVQLFLALFVMRFNKEKNNYRDGIFMALKENSVNFLSITKPFIIVDAYPDRFGKNAKPLYAVRGEIADAQIAETRDFIIRQKEAETQVVLRNVDNSAEIEQFVHPENTAPVQPTPAPIIEKATATEQPTKEQVINTMNASQPAAPVETDTMAEAAEPTEPLTDEEKEILINNLIDDTLHAEVTRAVKKATQVAQINQAPEAVEELAPLPTDTIAGNGADVTAPAEDDFSLDAIGLAIDAEISKRNKKSGR